jgi:heme exporter protein D
MAGLGEFLAMGGYAEFIWPAYGVTALILAALTVDSVRRRRRHREVLTALEAEGLGRRREGGA